MKNRIDEWRVQSGTARTPSIDASVSQPRAPTAEPEPTPATVASIEKARRTKEASTQFKQAAIFAWVVQQLYQPGHAVSRFRAGKMIYLIERAAEVGLFQGFLKQAAGPYDPALRYRGPENIAIRQQRWLENQDERHFKPGANINAVTRYVRRYIDVNQASAVIEHFRTFTDAVLGRWTTVDLAARELKSAGKPVTPESIFTHLAADPDWQHKIERSEFTVDHIARTLTGLRNWYSAR